ncbi:hypothetical protein [Pontibacter cellulosilyticus]|uniref:Uncharacterized protein n=1 Tax=Pontibacter cellulosilyticus TaxID=1720253 RepID=A0A923N744_9BACT|nr:hypothetical protein [Pontibacter cellulosilyticus]MBC5991715.1 hypothetical protein [Pontibacter cellulosilyticus]
MRPEDIDKLFKERLGNTSPTPSADLWSRLQDRMEAEMPQQVKPIVKEKDEKRGFMWIYSSVAATLSLLLTVGVVFYNIKSNPEVSETLAIQEKAVLQETPVYKAPETETLAQVETKTEKISEPQATEDATPASNITETVDKPATIAKATTKAVQQTKVTRATVAEQPNADVQQAIAVNTPITEKPAEIATVVPTAKPVMPSALAASAEMNARPVEITIKRSAAPAVASAQEQYEEESGLEKKAKLAKNIFKQARNLANGEQVELAALGIKADRVALETQIGKQKISKVINL